MHLPSSASTNRMALLLLTTAALLAAGCNGSSNMPPAYTGPTGAAFVIGTDAPMAAVTSFSVQIMSVEASDSKGNSVSLLTGTPTVDFARYNGLQTLLDMNDIPVGTYSSISITLGSGTIGYLDTPSGSAPTIQTEPATITQATTTVTLATPLVVAQAAAPVGLRVDFNLAQSIQVDSNGQITGSLTPVFNISTVTNSVPGAHIDEMIASVVSVDVGTNSFVVQGPHGEQFTVNVSSSTAWDDNASLSTLTPSSVVEVGGQLDRADQTLDADEVEVVSQSNFYASGDLTYVQPATGAATSFELYVRGLLPTTTGLMLGQIAHVNLSGSEKYHLYWMRNPMAQFLFNSSTLTPGQNVAIGGPTSGAANAQAVSVDRITLRPMGFDGTLVANSASSARGTFQMQINGFTGVLVPQTVTVFIGGKTGFRYGFGGFGDLDGSPSTTIRVVGLLLRNSTTGQPVLLARWVDHDHA